MYLTQLEAKMIAYKVSAIRKKKTAAEKDRSKQSIYKRRAEISELRELVSQLTEEEKQSDEYKDIVLFLEAKKEQKRLENIKYRDQKRLYYLKKKEEKKNHMCQPAVEGPPLLDKDLELYDFDIFHLIH